MTYATLDQLRDRYGEAMLVALSDRDDPPSGAIDADVVNRALADADAAIDGFLKGRYVLPLVATPPLLRDHALSIAFYKLHLTSVPDKVRDDYQDSIKALAQIASGLIRLDVAGVEPTASGNSGVKTNDRPRDMTPENLKGFI